MSNKKLKIGPELSISKGSSTPQAGVKIKDLNTFGKIKAELNLLDNPNYFLKLYGDVSKGSFQAKVSDEEGTKTYKGQSPLEKNIGLKAGINFKKGGTARIPRKPGQPAGSKKHSDLYTDENPKGTIHGLKFATESDARKSVAKIKASGKPHAHKVQAAIAMEQRAGVMGKASSAGVYRSYIDSIKKSKKSTGGFIIGKGQDYIKDLI